MAIAKGLMAAAVAVTLAGGAQAQGFNPPPPQGRGGPPPGQEPFSFQGDQIGPSQADPGYYRHYDPRYSQTYQQQMQEPPPKPGGGCLKYGAVGAAGGYMAGHTVLGAVAGCVTGHLVRKHEKERIQQQYGQ